MLEFLREYYTVTWTWAKNPWYWVFSLAVVAVAYAGWRILDRIRFGYWSWI